jgi:hypothetical protein
MLTEEIFEYIRIFLICIQFLSLSVNFYSNFYLIFIVIWRRRILFPSKKEYNNINILPHIHLVLEKSGIDFLIIRIS